MGSIPTQGTTNRKTVNRERASKRKLAFFLKRSDSIVFCFSKFTSPGLAQLEGNIAVSNESHYFEWILQVDLLRVGVYGKEITIQSTTGLYPLKKVRSKQDRCP